MSATARIVRLYVSTSPRGMDAERAWLQQHVFPELRRWCAERGVALEVIDPRTGGAAEGPGELRRWLEEVERCRPFFLAVVGQTYGDPVGPPSDEDVRAFPWLAQAPGLSRMHLEILHGVLSDPARPGHSYFYFRRPQSLDGVPPSRRNDLAAAGPEEEARLEDLRQAIRSSGRPVREYDGTWDPAGQCLTGLAQFGAQVLEDLYKAVESGLPSAPAASRGEGEASASLPPLDENVQFTVFRPKAIQPLRWYPLLAFAHLAERRPDAAADEPDPVAEVLRQARQVLGEQAREYQEVRQDSREAVPRMGELTFLPEVPNVEFNPPRRCFRWQESVHREEFRMRAAASLDGKTARGRLSVFLGSILLADVALSVRVDSGVRPATENLESSCAGRYRRVFPSYSHKDEEVVRQFEQYAQVVGDAFLRDCTTLRAGEVWGEKLLRLIEQADVFQLFWSHHSMRSPFVRREWEYALTLARPQFVRPIYWDDPLPNSPEEDLPPELLRRLHFQRIYVPSPPVPEPPQEFPPDGGTGGPAPIPSGRKPSSRLQGGLATLPRVGRVRAGETGSEPPGPAGFERLKSMIITKLVDKLDLSRVSDLEGETLRREVRLVVERLCDNENPLLNRMVRERLIDEVLDETFGFGPLEVLLKDPSISDILVNGPQKVYVERRGKMEKSDVKFRDSDHLLQIIDRIVSEVGRRVDETSPMVDARLPDGSRVNAIIPPLAVDGPCLSIRRFGSSMLRLEDLLTGKALTPEMAMLLEACVKARLNVVICGGTGSGKTTLLNTLAGFIPGDERIITVEDTDELRLEQEHVVRLETRPPNVEGKGAVTTRDLVRNALRMRPERLIIGECRGAETLDVLQAMSSGHAGSMTTLYAHSPHDALTRLKGMIAMAGLELSSGAMEQQIASAVDLLVQMGRLQGGPRKVTGITEVLHTEKEGFVLPEFFRFRQVGIDGQGRAFGQFEATGVRPTFAGRLEGAGIRLPAGLFQERVLLKD